MSAAAARDGISLVPISGFRAVGDQKHLFFDVKAQRGQVTTKRAEVSAPPGYSEHHTGYAVDIGDGKTPATNLSPTFENTSAFKWLEKNAAYYSFEISFPKDNPQGVNYEPWHWRFVGDTDSLKTFYKAKNLIRPASPSPTEPSATPNSPELTEPSATPTSPELTEPSATPTSPELTEPSTTP
jgi:D-alanyl-D-alanine carboxypeptidase